MSVPAVGRDDDGDDEGQGADEHISQKMHSRKKNYDSCDKFDIWDGGGGVVFLEIYNRNWLT